MWRYGRELGKKWRKANTSGGIGAGNTVCLELAMNNFANNSTLMKKIVNAKKRKILFIPM